MLALNKCFPSSVTFGLGLLVFQLNYRTLTVPFLQMLTRYEIFYFSCWLSFFSFSFFPWLLSFFRYFFPPLFSLLSVLWELDHSPFCKSCLSQLSCELVMSEAARHNSERYWYRLISVFCEWYNRLYLQGHVNEMAGKWSHWRQKPCYLSILCSLSLFVTSVVLVLKANPV